jgi:predicted secreted protein
MAILRSKVLGLYVLDEGDGQTDPFIVGDGGTLAAAATNAFANGLVAGEKALLSNGNAFFGLYTVTGTSASPVTTQITDFRLALAATNTNMDISNSVNEIVARDGAGGSETYIISGAQSWSFSGDGFLTDSSSDISHNIWGSSSGSKYVICKFDTDVTSNTSTNYVGQGLVESFSLSGGFDDNVSYSFTVNGYGKLYTYAG